MMLGAIRQWWWKRGYRRFYASPTTEDNAYAMNAGTAERFDQLVKELSAILKPSEQDQVLDLGGGNGGLSGQVFGRCRRLVVLDFCPSAMPSSSSFRRRFVVGDMKRPPFPPRAFSTLFTYSTFPHLASERQIKSILERWDALLAEGGVLYIGDIPERKAVPSLLVRALPHRGLKYYVAVFMSNYFSRAGLSQCLSSLGYEVTCIQQSAGRRFHQERFDILARKRATSVPVQS